MTKSGWRKLGTREIGTFFEHLEAMPEGQGLLYGLRGQKRNEFLSWVGASFDKPHVLYFTKDRIVLSRRHTIVGTEKSRREYGIGDLIRVNIIRGPLMESIQLEFRDGFTIKLRDVFKTQSDPVERMLGEGTSAFSRGNLSDEQIAHIYVAFLSAQLIPKNLLT